MVSSRASVDHACSAAGGDSTHRAQAENLSESCASVAGRAGYPRAPPDVLGPIPSSWAMPCFPFTGKQMGMWCLPQIGTGVWVEFEQGHPDYPIWSGCWYGIAAEVPALALAAPPAIP